MIYMGVRPPFLTGTYLAHQPTHTHSQAATVPWALRIWVRAMTETGTRRAEKEREKKGPAGFDWTWLGQKG